MNLLSVRDVLAAAAGRMDRAAAVVAVTMGRQERTSLIQSFPVPFPF